MIRLHPNFEKLVIPIKTPISDILDLSKGPQAIKHVIHCYPTKKVHPFSCLQQGASHTSQLDGRKPKKSKKSPPETQLI